MGVLIINNRKVKLIRNVKIFYNIIIMEGINCQELSINKNNGVKL
jgi:hypothetical protein